MKLTGADIRRQDFPRKMRGYDPFDVDAFLQVVADTADQLNMKNEELTEEVVELDKKVAEMQHQRDQLERSLQAVNDLREEVRTRTEALLENALAEAEQIMNLAEEDSSRIRQEAEWNSRRLREETSSLEKLRDKTIRDFAELLGTQTRLLANEAERMGVDILAADSGKVVPINHKAEGEGS